MPYTRRLSASVTVLATAAALLACSSPLADTGTSTTAASDEHAALSGELTIYAAASLTASFDELAEAFEAHNPGVTVRPIVYDGSNTLATQLTAGAPADVFASADEATMSRVVEAGLTTAEAPTLFASNSLVIVVPAGNPAEVETPDDLARDDLTLVLCAVEVPCGTASQQLLANWGVTTHAASFEQNVSAVLTKVAASEADAGLVYRTDVQARGDVEFIAPDGAADVVNRYPITALTASAHPAAAAAFVDFVTSEAGREILARHGFGAP